MITSPFYYLYGGKTQMTEKHNATCKICGKSYYACMSCADTIKLHPFKSFTDTAEHFKVFQAVKGFSTGVYTKEEFKSKLQHIDLSDLESYREHIKKIIKDVLEEEVVKEEEPIVTTEPIMASVNIVENSVDKNVEKIDMSRKRKFKIESEVE